MSVPTGLPPLPELPARPPIGSPGIVGPPQELPLEIKIQDMMRENCAVKAAVSGVMGKNSIYCSVLHGRVQ